MRTRILVASGAVIAALLPVAGLTSSAEAADPSTLQSQQIAVSLTHSLVIAADGRLYGAGGNLSSELCGAGARPELSELACPPDDESIGAEAVAAGIGFTLMAGSDGRAYGLGASNKGQLAGAGPGSSGFQLMTGLPDDVDAEGVAAGLEHSLVLGSDGVVYGAGDNAAGQLTGAGNKTTLTPLTGLPAGVLATDIAAGGNSSMVIGDDGIVYGAGSNSNGQITGGSATVATLTPFANQPAGVKAVAIAIGPGHSIVVGDNGVAYATGANTQRQLAGNDAFDKAILLPMQGLPGDVDAVGAAVGSFHSVILGSDGRLYGAGSNALGEITGTGAPLVLTPMQSAQGAGIDALAAGDNSTIKRDTDGIVYGTGANLGDRMTVNAGNATNAFVQFAGLTPTPISEPAFTGLARVGSTINVSSGQWIAPPTSYTYQWQRNALTIPGATSRSYSPVPADVGKNLDVLITAHRSGFTPGTVTVSAGKVALGPALVRVGVKPAVSGVLKSGRLLGISGLRTTSFKPTATSFRFQWLRNGQAIPGAVARTYRLKAADKGKLVKVRITAVKAGYANGNYVTAARRVAN